jgi:DNA modification methylase
MSSLQCGIGTISRQCGIIEKSDIISEQIIIWCELNKEQKDMEVELKKNNISFVSLYGSESVDAREKKIESWKNKEVSVFLSKAMMYGAGVNMQQCQKMIFLGISYKFYLFIQAVHRIHRFLQDKKCEIHIIYAESEEEILKVLKHKWANHNKMVENMTEIIKKHGLNSLDIESSLQRSIGVERIEVNGKYYQAVNNDCIVETEKMDSDSIDLIHTSIPFSNHYEYSPSYNDLGHNIDNNNFFEQMDYLTPQLKRVLKPGRVAAIHVKDRILFGNVTGHGMPTVDPFHCTCIAHYQKHGFVYFGMITVVTDVVRENNQTYRLGWSEQCKDGSKMGVGSPEYILLFRKLPTDTSNGYADNKIAKSKKEYTRSRWQIDAHAMWRSSGNKLLSAEEMSKYPVNVLSTMYTKYSLENVYDYEHHYKIGEELDKKGCLPSSFMVLAPGSHKDSVWHDILRMNTLNGEQTRKGLNNHICPLQIDIVDRIITRYSNKDELVYDPFAGLMTVPYRAIELGRRGKGCELNHQYFLDGIKNLKSIEEKRDMPTLFDFEDVNSGSESELEEIAK